MLAVTLKDGECLCITTPEGLIVVKIPKDSRPGRLLIRGPQKYRFNRRFEGEIESLEAQIRAAADRGSMGTIPVPPTHPQDLEPDHDESSTAHVSVPLALCGGLHTGGAQDSD